MAVDFCDYFWGDKNQGFEVLYQNMKYGYISSKDLGDFLRERISADETSAKSMIKLAKQASSSSPCGSFAPVWQLLKSSCEKLGALHLQLVQRISELVKDVNKYSEELSKKHKSVKDEESSTLEVVQALQSVTINLQKNKETYLQRGSEFEKLRKDSASVRDVERAEIKFRKAAEDYKSLVSKHGAIREDFERKMTVSCRHFQEVEEVHLKQMREFVFTYAALLQNSHRAMGQVHVELQDYCQDLSVEKMLEQFASSKCTGLEKPVNVAFEAYNALESGPEGGGDLMQLDGELAASGAAPGFSTLGKDKDKNRRNSASSNSNNVLSVSGNTKREGKGLLSRRRWSQSQDRRGGARDRHDDGQGADHMSKEADTRSGNAEISKGRLRPSRRTSSLINIFHGHGDKDKDCAKADSGRDPIPSESGKSSPGPEDANVASHSNSETGFGSGLGSRVSSFRNSKSADSSASSSPPPPTQPRPSYVSLASWTSGFLKSRRDRKKEKEKEKEEKKKTKKKRDPDAASMSENRDEPLNDAEDGSEEPCSPAPTFSPQVTPPLLGVASSSSLSAANLGSKSEPQSPDVDEEGYRIRPTLENWSHNEPQGGDSSSDSDSDDERDRKFRVEIKPLSNGDGPMSASVDELRATVGSFNLSTTAMFNNAAKKNVPAEAETTMKKSVSLGQHSLGKSSQDLAGLNFSSPPASTLSSPSVVTPPPVLSLSPTGQTSGSASTEASRYATASSGEMDLFAEVGEIVPALPPKANATSTTARAPGSRGATPTLGSIALPRPPSRRSGANLPQANEAPARPPSASSATASVSLTRADSASSLGLSGGLSYSRGPSPLTLGLADTIPLAIAFQEVIHAFFRGQDESVCQVRILGDVLVSFPAGIVQFLSHHPAPPLLTFRLKNVQRLDMKHIQPNLQLLTMNHSLLSPEPVFEFNMNTLTALLKRQAEHNPQAAYFNVDVLKYQVKAGNGASSCPLHLVCYWKCEAPHTDLRLNYKYNGHAMAAPHPLLNLHFSVPVEGGVSDMAAVPSGQWMSETGRALWRIPDLAGHGSEGGIGSLRARFELSSGPGSPGLAAVQFVCEGTTLSGADLELVGGAYRLSLVKRRFISGKYLCESDSEDRNRYAAPPGSGPTHTDC